MKVRAVIAVPLVLLAVALAGGSVLVLRAFFLSVLLPLVSYLWTVLSLRGISVTSEAPPGHCQVGRGFQQAVTVHNGSRFPGLWLRLEEFSDLPGRHDATVVNLAGRGSLRWDSQLDCRRRGRYTVGRVKVSASDPFGLFTRERVLGDRHEVLVYPATLELPLFKAASFDEIGLGSGFQSVNLLSPNASSVREFYSGDSLNHIHWASTAHTGRLMVKMFDADRSSTGSKTIWVVLDMMAGVQAGEGDESTEEYAVTLAASLAKKYLDAGMKVGLLAAGDASILVPPERGEEQLWRLLERLAVVRAEGQTPVGRLLVGRTDYLRGDSTVIIVTPSVSTAVFEAVRQLRSRVDGIVVVQLDPASFGAATSALTAARNLGSTGVQVYLVHRGDELGRALDHRISLLPAGRT